MHMAMLARWIPKRARPAAHSAHGSVPLMLVVDRMGKSFRSSFTGAWLAPAFQAPTVALMLHLEIALMLHLEMLKSEMNDSTVPAAGYHSGSRS
jgi:hypothetical protein